ncbi:MAG: hypothetical protein AAF086_07120 [Planctomycetota bacterium]
MTKRLAPSHHLLGAMVKRFSRNIFEAMVLRVVSIFAGVLMFAAAKKGGA